MNCPILFFKRDDEKILEFVKSNPAGGKIVFTNGCFDILHTGHIEVFKYCKDIGKTLIVGLNSDDSVVKLKGPKRPVLNIQERAPLIAAVRYVDLVVVFGEETPLELIKLIRPDIIVKGGDYRQDSVIGREIAPETRIFPLVEGAGTSKIIERIIQRYCEKETE